MPNATMDLVCAWCGTEFTKQTAEVRRQTKKGRKWFFCSLSCAATFGNVRRKNKPITKTCPHCGDDFETHTGTRGATFCSRSCASAGSVTPARRRAGRRIAEDFPPTLEVTAAGLRAREAWRYEEVATFLGSTDESHQFEYPMGGVGIFDLALLDRKVLVEFDGPEHAKNPTAAQDEERDHAASIRGWKVLRMAVEPGQVISLVDFMRNVWKRLEPRGSGAAQ